MSEPERIQQDTKCPVCDDGTFQQRSTVTRSERSEDGIQKWYWTCTSDYFHRCRRWYDQDSLQLRDNGYYAVAGDRVVVARNDEIVCDALGQIRKDPLKWD
ncbi:hypothetical protein [Streptomyces sp. NPDC057363]|uniref:hypothetical protein n=1 Tax=Streptomyces sp. NPDC057363 TaxID=3346107 RepID=UPI0036387E96